MKDPDTSTACFQHKYITAFFYAAFAIPLAAQLFSLVQEAAQPTELKTTMNKESLSTFDDFPLLGRICVKTGLDVKKLRYYGYSDPSGFYMGVSRFNALCCYPNVNGAIRNLSLNTSTASIFLQFNYFRENIWVKIWVQFHFLYIFVGRVDRIYKTSHI